MNAKQPATLDEDTAVEVRRLILGSVARNVLLHAPCSVLIAREVVAPSSGEPMRAEDAELVGLFG